MNSKQNIKQPPFHNKSYNEEVMKEYSLEKLKLKGRITLSLGDIVALKALAIRKGFMELADKLRQEEKKILLKASKVKS